jgi:hypothetical protein
LLVAAFWVKDGVRGPVSSITAPLLPAFVSASSTSDEQYRTLIVRPDGAGLDYLVVRQRDPSLGEPELGTASAAGAVLSRQVAALGAPDGADAGDPGLVLGSFGIRWVLLPGPVDPVLAQRLDAALGLVALNKGPSYDLWQVTGPVARVRVVASDGTTTALPSGAVTMSGVTAPASGGTLILAEPYGGWTATLNGQALKPVATSVNGWAQGFVLPPGGGQLSITRNNLARVLSLVLELLATLAICLLALPGKRADPVEEAKALTALREARNGKRAAGSSTRRAVRSVRTAGAGHRAAGVDRLRFPRRRAGQARPDLEPVSQAPEGQPAADEMPAAEASGDAELAGSARSEAMTAVGLADWGQERADWGQDSHSRRAEEDETGGSSGAPWDMVGDWEAGSRTGASNAWTADPLETAKFPEDAGKQDDPDQQASAPSSPVPESRVPRSPVPESRVPVSPVLGTPVPETQPPWATGPQRAPWESGPQDPVSSTGVQPRFTPSGPQSASRSGAQPRFTPSGPQSASRSGSQSASRSGAQPSFTPSGPQPTSRSGSQPASRSGAQPTSRSGSQPASGTGAQPVPRAAEQPATATGTQPVQMAPWESGDWDKAPDWDAIPGNRVAPPAAPEPEPEAAPEPAQGTGSGAWPVTARPAKPERHSHRAAKHGRPSRRRGSGNRSSGDGES